MLQKRWVQWLLIWLAVAAMGLGIGLILELQGTHRVAHVVRVIAGAISFLWLCWGLWCWREQRWVRVVSWMIAGAWGLVLLYLTSGLNGFTIAGLGSWGTAVVFFVGLWLIRRLLSPGYPVLGVARTLVDEAIRMKIALIFIALLVMVVPVLFVVMDPQQRLEYRIQMFLAWSLTSVSLLLSLITIFLACGTICTEVSQRQIFLTLSKPVSRAQYLLGKWLGILLINALLLSVASGGIYLFAKLLQQQDARDDADRVAVDFHLMVARLSTRPHPAQGMDLNTKFEERREQLAKEDPVRFAAHKLLPKDRQEIEKAIVRKWYTVAPRGTERYLFTGLDRAKQFSKFGQTIQLRFKPQGSRSAPDGKARLAFHLNGRPWPTTPDGLHIPIEVSDGDFHVINLPVAAIDHAGNLEVAISNVNLPTWPVSISFPPSDGLEVLYQVGEFEPNFVRTLVIVYIRLAFLAVLGLMAGTFLGFPVACLLSLLVYTIGSASSFLSEALTYYAVSPTEDVPGWQMITSFISYWFTTLISGEVWNAIKMLIKLAGEFIVTVLPSFSDFDPVPLVCDGRLVSQKMIVSAILKVGLLWTGICALVALLVFRSRELARVTV